MTDFASSTPEFTEPSALLLDEEPRPLSTASLIIGFCSIAFWFTFFAPLVGLVLGIVGLRREPSGRTFALVGIWTNAVMLTIAFISLVLLGILLSVGIAGLAAWHGAGSGYSIGS